MSRRSVFKVFDKKEVLGGGGGEFGATLNFQKFKLALNPSLQLV